MRTVKFTDWSALEIKKDIEHINKKIGIHESLLATISIEVVISVGVLILDHLFDTNQAPKIAWIGAFLVTLLPPMLFFCKRGITWIKKASRVRNGKYDISTYVDTFDNSVCYWALMSRSFLQFLKENDKEMSPEEKLFYYQEIHFYINKSCKKLDEMMPVAEKVFSYKAEEIKNNKLISLQRLNIIVNLLNQVETDSNAVISDIKAYETIIEDQIHQSRDFHDMLERFMRKIKQVFPEYTFV